MVPAMDRPTRRNRHLHLRLLPHPRYLFTGPPSRVLPLSKTKCHHRLQTPWLQLMTLSQSLLALKLLGVNLVRLPFRLHPRQGPRLPLRQQTPTKIPNRD